MKFKALIVCETCLIDGRTNALSFINILEEINISSVPAMLNKVSIIAMLSQESPGENASVPLDVSVTLNDESIIMQPITVDFGQRTDTRFILDIGGIPIKSGGVLKFSVGQNGREMIEYRVSVNLKEQLVTRVD